jgi:hypothetical protein
MAVKAHEKYPLTVDGKPLGKLGTDKKITLRWPRWYPPTAQDRTNTASTLKTHKESGHISRETAVKSIAADYDIEDVNAELARIDSDQKKELAMLPAPKSAVSDTV